MEQQAYRDYSIMPQQQQHNSEDRLLGELREKVVDLQLELNALRRSDVNDFRRAYRTFTQHAQALDVEAKHIANVINEVDTPVLSAGYVQEQVSALACIAAGVWTFRHLALNVLKISGSGPVTRGVAIAGACLAGLRFVVTSGRRVVSVRNKNRRTKQQLQDDWAVVAQRIAMIMELVETSPLTALAQVQAQPTYQDNAPPAPPLYAPPQQLQFL